MPAAMFCQPASTDQRDARQMILTLQKEMLRIPFSKQGWFAELCILLESWDWHSRWAQYLLLHPASLIIRMHACHALHIYQAESTAAHSCSHWNNSLMDLQPWSMKSLAFYYPIACPA
jgi:hypothetical protein